MFQENILSKLNVSTPKKDLTIASMATMKDQNRIFSSEQFTLYSTDFLNNDYIPTRFAHENAGGDNVLPTLIWANPPVNTKSFALFVHDPDAPTGGAGFWHWIVLDIPATHRELSQSIDFASTGIRQMRNDYGSQHWGGPCPPKGHGVHRYNFVLYAVEVEKLNISLEITAFSAGFHATMSSIESTRLIGLYSR